MPSPRTSKTHPLQIATVAVPGTRGVIGLTLCPGKKDQAAMTGAWKRDLETDVRAIRAWGAGAVVCLMESFELKLLDVEALSATVESEGMRWLHLPIRDVSVPSVAFENLWTVKGSYPSGVGHLYAEDLIVKIEGPGGTMIVSA